MHQPEYRDRDRKKILLPWVRLHALKDYYDMPARLERFPGIRQTFNLVPSLIDQLECYGSEEWGEMELDLFLKPAPHLSEREKHTILADFFNAPEDRMIRPHPRYASLLREKRLRDPVNLVQRWSDQEWRDLQFWRQLAWIDPLLRERDSVLEDLVRQGQNFSEENKQTLLERMRHWMRESVTIYRRLQEEGVIEVTVSPYYHPILPLLLDSTSVHEAMPDCPLPEPHGSHPDDARAQMVRAIEFYEERFGVKPRGVWPPEGSVSQETAALMADLGVEWIASDEDILFRSIGLPARSSTGHLRAAAEVLYRPYKTLGGKGPSILFRDHRLSDLIGFEYQHWGPKEAADHFVAELQAISKAWTGSEPPLVSVILDGENCWEYYEGDGGPFLDALYERILGDSRIECVTASQALQGRVEKPIERLSAGSWINGNFHIWMGEEADRKAWAMLETARQTLVEAEREGSIPEETIREAWNEIYIAQGSDWFWWFGDAHTATHVFQFDEMFRHHLVRIYELLDRHVPSKLLAPLATPLTQRLNFPVPVLLTPPEIDGTETHYYEWLSAARFDTGRQGGAMRTAERSNIRVLYYGGDRKEFYLRADPVVPPRKSSSHVRWELRVTAPRPLRIRFTFTPEGYRIEKARHEESNEESGSRNSEIWELLDGNTARAAENTVFETALSWDVLEIGGEETLSFFLSVWTGKREMEMIPSLSCLCMTIPRKGGAGRPWFA
jgi:alpha-amylase/alpha-mannosidase (GH57 family)